MVGSIAKPTLRAGARWAAVGSTYGLLCVANHAANAAAWTLEDGKWQIITTAAASRALQEFDDSGDLQPREAFHKYAVRTYVEYGLTNWLTLSAEPSFERIDIGTGDTRETKQGLNSTGLAARIRVAELGRHIFSLQPTVYLPGQLKTTETTVQSFGSFDFDARLLYGGSAEVSFLKKDWPVFWGVEASYRLRANDPPNEVHADLTAGIGIRENVQILGQMFSIISVGPNESESPFADFSLHKVQMSTVYRVTDHISVQVGGFTAIAGRNTIQEDGAIAALWLNF